MSGVDSKNGEMFWLEKNLISIIEFYPLLMIWSPGQRVFSLHCLSRFVM